MLLSIFVIFHCASAVLTTFLLPVSNLISSLNSACYKDAVISGAQCCFQQLCDGCVHTCAVSTLLLLLVASLLPEIDLSSVISYKTATWTFCL